MVRAKNYKVGVFTGAPDLATSLASAEAWIDLPPNPRSHRVIDFRSLLGRGVDEWISAAITVLKARLNSGHYSVATVVSFASNGIKVFLPYLIQAQTIPRPEKPSELKQRDVSNYIAWLRLKYPNGATAKNYYSGFKSIVTGLADYGFITSPIEAIFPANPFPNNGSVTRGEVPLKPTEMQRLAAALKADLVAIHHGRYEGLDSDALVVLMLITAMRSGINSTPLLEMARDCLTPHPFMPNLMLVNTFKRRGKGAQLTTLRQTQLHDQSTSIPMDGVAVIQKVLAITQPLISDAPEAIKDRIWLYRSSQRGQNKGQILCLSGGTVSQLTRNIIQRHGLLADDGGTLRVTLGRLRKTMENRLWTLSDGDLLAVASVMGHSPQVADNHYLRLDERTMAEGAKFIGEALPDKLRGLPLMPTPTGSCKDSLHGDLAPKDGSSHCAEFMHCLSCPSYAIVGTEKDLYRLFSFQRFLLTEIDYYVADEWKEWQRHHKRLIVQIDQITSENFPLNIVELAKSRAVRDPHPFWAMRMRESRTKNEVGYGG